MTFRDKGVVPTVYEASGRIGGRMHSEAKYWAYDGYSPISEYCGEFIDSGHDGIIGMAQRFGLPLDDVIAAERKGTDETYFLQTAPNVSTYGFYSVADAIKDFGPVFDAANVDANNAGYPALWNSFNSYAQALDRMSVFEWIVSRVPGGVSSNIGRLLNSAYEQEYAALTTDQSALNLVYLISSQPTTPGFSIYGLSDQRYRIRGGNQRLPRQIAAYLDSHGVEIARGYTLKRIAQNSSQVELEFDTGSGSQTVVADHVILTLPFSVLRTLDYSQAQFTPRKLLAVTQLGAGRNAKLMLQYTRRFWSEAAVKSNGDVYTDLGFRYFVGPGYRDLGIQAAWDSTRAQPGPYGVLTNYTGAEAAAAFAPGAAYSFVNDPEVRRSANHFARQFDRIFPGSSDLWNGKALLSVPMLDPNLKLSYSYWRVGQYTRIAGYERVAQGRIHFAGEHCSINYQGYMEGGAQEGHRAAKEVLAAFA